MDELLVLNQDKRLRRTVVAATWSNENWCPSMFTRRGEAEWKTGLVEFQ